MRHITDGRPSKGVEGGQQSCSCAQLVQKSSAHPDPREALTSQQKSIKVTHSKSISSVLTFNSNSKGKAMSEEVKVILELSDDVQTLLEEQGIDLYQELQQELPLIHLQKQSDPEAPPGSRDLATVILATASLVTALTPVIIRILNQI